MPLPPLRPGQEAIARAMGIIRDGDYDPRERCQGRYLCETCGDAMTDRVVMIGGQEQAQCEVCGR